MAKNHFYSFFLPSLLCWVLSLGWSHYPRSSCVRHKQWDWTPDKNTVAEPEQQSSLALVSVWGCWWCPSGMGGRMHCSLLHLQQLCGAAQRVSLYDPLNLARGWCQLASLYTSLQTVLACKLSRTAPKSSKTKRRVGAHGSVWRRLIWAWMEGKPPAGQSYCCILTQIFMLWRHAFLTGGGKQGYLAL